MRVIRLNKFRSWNWSYPFKIFAHEMDARNTWLTSKVISNPSSLRRVKFRLTFGTDGAPSYLSYLRTPQDKCIPRVRRLTTPGVLVKSNIAATFAARKCFYRAKFVSLSSKKRQKIYTRARCRRETTPGGGARSSPFSFLSLSRHCYFTRMLFRFVLNHQCASMMINHDGDAETSKE